MRLDNYLFANNFAQSRSKAKQLIDDKRVTVNDSFVTKPSYQVEASDRVEVIANELADFVGRGGLKLEHAINSFGIDAGGKTCADIGASTGGFTECLLRHGAKKVYAVDCGKGQLSQVLLDDTRVVNLEGINARTLDIDLIEGNFADIVVMDVSFISQKLIYPAIKRISATGADIVTLIKPQFEAGKENIGKKGIVKDKKIHRAVVEDIINFAKSSGFEYLGVTESPIHGADGNTEFLLHLRNT